MTLVINQVLFDVGFKVRITVAVEVHVLVLRYVEGRIDVLCATRKHSRIFPPPSSQ